MTESAKPGGEDASAATDSQGGLRPCPPRKGPPASKTNKNTASCVGQRARGPSAPRPGRGKSRRRAVPPATHLLLPPGHVCGLLGVEGVRDASHHEDVELQADPPLLLLIQLPLGFVSPLADHRGARAPGSVRATAARAPRRVPPPFPSRGGQRSLRTAGRHRHLAALLLQPLVRLLFAGRRVQHGARGPKCLPAPAAAPAGLREPRGWQQRPRNERETGPGFPDTSS